MKVLSVKKLQPFENPIDHFRAWFETACEQTELKYPNAMCLSTVDENDRPVSRMVLLKSYDNDGFVFFTNKESRKGQNLAISPYAALCFYWQVLGWQVRIEGEVLSVSDEEADNYFSTRPRGSQIGAWASQQSKPMLSRYELEKNVGKYMTKFHVKKIPRPEFWSGYRVCPERIEFWQEGKYRLHDRLVYKKTVFDKLTAWKTEWLFP